MKTIFGFVSLKGWDVAPYLLASITAVIWSTFFWPGMVFWDSSTQWNWAFAYQGGFRPDITNQWPITNTLIRIPFTGLDVKTAIGLFGTTQSLIFFNSIASLVCSFSISNVRRMLILSILCFTPIIFVHSQLQAPDVLYASGFLVIVGIFNRQKQQQQIGIISKIVFILCLLLIVTLRREGIVFAILIITYAAWNIPKKQSLPKKLLITAISITASLILALLLLVGENNQDTIQVRTDGPAFAILFWRSGGLSRMPLAEFQNLQKLGQTTFDSKCEPMLMWCDGHIDSLVGEAIQVPREIYISEFFREIKESPFALGKAGMAGILRQAGINYPLINMEIGRTDTPDVRNVEVNNFNYLQDKIIGIEKLQQLGMEGFFSRPYIWILLLLCLRLIPKYRKNYWLDGTIFCWVTYIFISAFLSGVADFRYQFAFFCLSYTFVLMAMVNVGLNVIHSIKIKTKTNFLKLST